jgi:hypothetical protein
MSIFSTQADVAAPTETLGGGFRALETGVYDMAIDMAYLDQSKGGAYSLNLVLKSSDGKTYKETLWVTSGTAKGVLNYYLDKEGKKQYLPGFNIANAIATLASGKSMADLVPETKMVNIRNFELKKDVPTAKDVFTELLGLPIKVAIIKQKVLKQAKDASGNYVDTTDTKEENEINGVFSAETNQSFNEYTNGEAPTFMDKWIEANDGKTRDRTKPKGGATAGAPAAAAPTKSLFGK